MYSDTKLIELSKAWDDIPNIEDEPESEAFWAFLAGLRKTEDKALIEQLEDKEFRQLIYEHLKRAHFLERKMHSQRIDKLFEEMKRRREASEINDLIALLLYMHIAANQHGVKIAELGMFDNKLSEGLKNPPSEESSSIKLTRSTRNDNSGAEALGLSI